jgi:hypothetical protein
MEKKSNDFSLNGCQPSSGQASLSGKNFMKILLLLLLPAVPLMQNIPFTRPTSSPA